MDWSLILCSRRLGRGVVDADDPHRSPFEVDTDRICFSSEFRRLQGKTQVHGPAGNDYVRDRLTHSLEVARVGRTLGTIVGARLAPPASERNPNAVMTPRDCGHAVSAACAAHDFGTPCYAHQGEAMISDFFTHHPLGRALCEDLSPRMRAELEAFEGNAQGFRVLARLQGWRRRGGLNLTMATLAAHAKYPHAADAPEGQRLKAGKYGYFDSEAEIFAEVAEATGMIPTGPGSWARHPLAFLVEAADDICYRIVDVEDAAILGVIDFEEAQDLLTPVIGEIEADYLQIQDISRKLTFLRSRAISRLIEDAADAFMDNLEGIRDGQFRGELIRQSPVREALDRIERVSRSRIYVNKARQDIDLQAARVINTLLEAYCEAFLEQEESRSGRLSNRAKTILRSFPGVERINFQDRAAWLRVVLDYVAGMTDSFAFERAELLRRGGAAAAPAGRASPALDADANRAGEPPGTQKCDQVPGPVDQLLTQGRIQGGRPPEQLQHSRPVHCHRRRRHRASPLFGGGSLVRGARSGIRPIAATPHMDQPPAAARIISHPG